MRPIIAALPLALSMALASPILAETREERLALASDYVEQTLEDVDMEALIRSMWEPLAEQVAASGQEVTDAQREEIHQLYMDTYEQRMTEMMQSQDEVMADLFTMAEIEALTEFYGTPEGRAVMQKLPQLSEASQPKIMTMMQETMPTVMGRVQQILAPEQPGTDAAPQAGGQAPTAPDAAGEGAESGEVEEPAEAPAVQ